MDEHEPQLRPPRLDGDKLRRAREKAGLSQRELAGLLGVSQPLVSKWELGIHGCHRLQFPLIAKAVGCEDEPERIAHDTVPACTGTAAATAA